MTARVVLPPGTTLRYDCDLGALPEELRAKFVPVELGDEGHAFLDQALSTRPGRARTTLQRTLRTFMSDFDANGLLGMYPMHLLGTAEWRALIRPGAARHLDVGAGSGDVTSKVSPLAHETTTTETSRMMVRNLRRRGFRCFETDVAERGVPDPRYDLVTCLNVVDRCARPLSLLANLSEAVAPGGQFIIATPFPFDPFVYAGPRSLPPTERLNLSPLGGDRAGAVATWESSLASLAGLVSERFGLEIQSVSRAPYLCRGDADEPLYVLDDAILVFRKPPP